MQLPGHSARRWRRGAAGLSAALAVVLLSPVSAWACSCLPTGPACQVFFQAHAVFVGRVLGITTFKVPSPIPNQNVTFGRRRVRLAIAEAFSGVSGNEVEVTTGVGGGDCGYDFVIG